jgi:hypothetical protein
MQSNRARALLGLGVLAAAVVLFIVLSSGSDDGSSTQQTTRTSTNGTSSGATAAAGNQQRYTIIVKNAKPLGGVKKLVYKKGEQVRFVVRSDVTDEIHVHGYNRLSDVRAGGSVRFDFPAKLEGVFDIELEQRGEQIAELRVNP